MRVEYTARRNIAPGHTLNEAYELVVLGEQYEDDFAFADTRNISLDKSRVEVDLWGVEQTIDVVTDLIPVASASLWEEFFHSVAAGEDFIIDLGSDVAESVVSPLTVIMESNRYRRSKPINGYVQYRFEVRAV